MNQPPAKPRRWLLAVDPRVYHWDTLFVKGKEMGRHAGSRPDTLRQLKQVHKGDRALLYHGKAEHALYTLAGGGCGVRCRWCRCATTGCCEKSNSRRIRGSRFVR